MNTANRRPPGTRAGGQFAPGNHPESATTLDGTEAVSPYDDALAASGWDDPGPPVEDVAAAQGDELWSYVRHPDPAIRAEAAHNAWITDEHLDELMAPSQPLVVRLSIAHMARPGISRRAAADPSPVVRALALDRADLPDEDRARLESDPAVTAAYERMRSRRRR